MDTIGKIDQDKAGGDHEETSADGVSSGTVNGVAVQRAFPTQWERMHEGGADYIRNEMTFSLEFQTLRRLPSSRFILFTVRRYVDPMVNLEQWPAAAAALAGAMRRKFKGTLTRSGLGERENAEPLLAWLDGVAEASGVVPGLKGVVKEPWERAALVDGTSAPAKDAEIRAAAALPSKL